MLTIDSVSPSHPLYHYLSSGCSVHLGHTGALQTLPTLVPVVLENSALTQLRFFQNITVRRGEKQVIAQ